MCSKLCRRQTQTEQYPRTRTSINASRKCYGRDRLRSDLNKIPRCFLVTTQSSDIQAFAAKYIFKCSIFCPKRLILATSVTTKKQREDWPALPAIELIRYPVQIHFLQVQYHRPELLQKVQPQSTVLFSSQILRTFLTACM